MSDHWPELAEFLKTKPDKDNMNKYVKNYVNTFQLRWEKIRP